MAKLVEDRVKTGIEGYDKLLGGGYKPGSVNLISGCSGAGKTLFAINFVYTGLEKYGEKGAYITLEEGKLQIIDDCKSIGFDLEGMEDKGLLLLDVAAIRETYKTVEELTMDNTPLDIEVLVKLIYQRCRDVKRIAIDSVVPLSMRYDNLNEFRANLFRLRSALRSMEVTSVITTEIPVSSQDISRFGIEDFLSDSVTVLRVNGDERKLSIHKIRGSDHYKLPVDYSITDNGIVVSY